jgi:ferredoxin-fold anticodon binding domain-containing protein
MENVTMLLSFADTHSYPGCRVIVRPDGAVGQEEAFVEFSDGVTVLSVLEQVGPKEIVLRIGPYRTARGTSIKEKVWILKRSSEQEWQVARKA